LAGRRLTVRWPSRRPLALDISIDDPVQRIEGLNPERLPWWSLGLKRPRLTLLRITSTRIRAVSRWTGASVNKPYQNPSNTVEHRVEDLLACHSRADTVAAARQFGLIV